MLKIIPYAVGIENVSALEPNCSFLCALLQNIPPDKENVELQDMQLGPPYKHNLKDENADKNLSWES